MGNKNGNISDVETLKMTSKGTVLKLVKSQVLSEIEGQIQPYIKKKFCKSI